MRKSILVGLVAFVCAALIDTSRQFARVVSWAVDRFDRGLRWLFAAAPRQALAFAGPVGALDPQPGFHPIADQLYNRNRHEALSHTRAAHRRI